ncbi:MAG TPA: SRPBCC family protein [Calditrichia bacterium]|nr:SRPBCC family protein [Calditrichota bacterium]HQV33169.1 SRPBCC family protein [Calditrichia bacterium]
MQIRNTHRREMNAPIETVGALLDTLASREDRLWPGEAWPRMKFDRPLSVGADGGHGPIRYFVEEYQPSTYIRFRFTGPRGFDGFHELRMEALPENQTFLIHNLEMSARGIANLSWPLIFRPLHDALVEDAFTKAQAQLGLSPEIQPWSLQVRFLRWALTLGKASPQPYSQPVANTP